MSENNFTVNPITVRPKFSIGEYVVFYSKHSSMRGHNTTTRTAMTLQIIGIDIERTLDDVKIKYRLDFHHGSASDNLFNEEDLQTYNGEFNI